MAGIARGVPKLRIYPKTGAAATRLLGSMIFAGMLSQSRKVARIEV